MFRLLGHKAYSMNTMLNIKNFVYLAILGVCLQFVTSFLLGAILNFMPVVRDDYLSHIATFSTPDTATIIMTAVLAPIYEELIFRGLIYGVADIFMPSAIAIVLQAVLFGLYHGNTVQCIYAIVLGMIIGYVRMQSGNVLSTMVLHMLINSTGLALSYISIYINSSPGDTVAMVSAAIASIIGIMTALQLKKIWNSTAENK